MMKLQAPAKRVSLFFYIIALWREKKLTLWRCKEVLYRPIVLSRFMALGYFAGIIYSIDRNKDSFLLTVSWLLKQFRVLFVLHLVSVIKMQSHETSAKR